MIGKEIRDGVVHAIHKYAKWMLYAIWILTALLFRLSLKIFTKIL